MRIRVVRIRNLNSLRGDFTIDFTASPLADTGLFAITGDTGAGKTTILDAITLALFGKTSRGHESEVMSYGTGECLAEVDFSAGPHTYRARWATHRARRKADGNLQPPQRDLSKRSDDDAEFKLLSDKVRELNSGKESKGLIEQVCGLNYEQFIRSVLLAQGQFAAFLQAKEGDRSILLERITGTDIYTRLSKAAFGRHRLEREKLDTLSQQLAHSNILPPEAERDLRDLLAENNKAAKQATRTRTQLEKQLRWYDELAKAEQKKADAAVALQEIQQGAEALRAQRAQLERHRELLPLRTDLQRFDDQVENRTDNETRRAALAVQFDEIKAKQQQIEAKLKTAEAELAAFKKTWKKRSAELDEVDKLDVQRIALQKPLRIDEERAQKLRQQQTDQAQEQATLAKSLAIDREQLEADKNWLNNHRAYAKLSGDIVRIKSCRDDLRSAWQLDKAARDSKASFAEILAKVTVEYEGVEQQLTQIAEEQTQAQVTFQSLLPESVTASQAEALELLNDRLERLRERRRIGGEQRRLERELADMRAKLTNQEKERDRQRTAIRQNEQARADLTAQLDEVQSQFLVISREYQREAERHGAQAMRRTLQPDEPCPVCGSLDHPYAVHAPEEDAAFAKLQSAYDKERLRVDQLSVALDELLSAQRTLTQALTDVNATIELTEQQTAAAQANLRALQPADAAQIVSTAGIGAQIEQEQANLQRARTESRRLESLNQKQNELQLAQSDRRARLQVLQTQIEGEQARIDEAKAKFADSKTCLNDLLEPYGRRFEMDTAAALFDELEKLAKAYEDRKTRRQRLEISVAKDEKHTTQLDKTLQKIALELRELQAQIVERQSQLTALDTRRQALFTAADTQLARRDGEARFEALEQASQTAIAAAQATERTATDIGAQLRVAEERAETLTAATALLQTSLTARLANFALTRLADLRAALLDESTATQLRQTLEAHQQRLTRYQQSYTDADARVGELRNQPPAAADESTLRARLQTTETDIEAAQVAIGQLQQQLKDNKQRKARSQQLVTEIEAQQAETDRWARLNELIGSGDGKRFRVFAQGLTLQRLVGLANRHLNKLSGRYRIRKQPGDSLDLKIIDTYQADFERGSATLSGGESFLVSLALALGLSDLAGRHARIETLFIDEGFGTLDQNTLDIALTTLENLQADGKTIGIISHVKELQERIQTQIRVKKGGSGFSTLEIV